MLRRRSIHPRSNNFDPYSTKPTNESATMITVTRLNGSHFAVNPDLIERIHENPDTTLVLVDGSTFILTEPLTEVVRLIAEYRARVIGLAFAAQSGLGEQDAPGEQAAAAEQTGQVN